MDNGEFEKIQIFSNRVICCAQDDENSDTFKSKFVICDFSTNGNSVGINRDKIESWMKTLVNKPLVGKLASTVKGGMDFTGHNMRIVWKKDEHGNVYKDVEFDTSAFGTFTDVKIEKIDDVECIVATCEIWKRFRNACAVIMKRVESGTLNSSWEITIFDSHVENIGGKSVKIIDNGIFTAHCLLGENVKPAYDCSRLIEVAEVNQDAEGGEVGSDDVIAAALGQDIDSFENESKMEEIKVQRKENTAFDGASSVEASACGTGKKKEKAEDMKDKKKKDMPDSPDDSGEPGVDDTQPKDDNEKQDAKPPVKPDAKQDGDAPVNEPDDKPDDTTDDTTDDKKKKKPSKENSADGDIVVPADITSCDLEAKLRDAVRDVVDGGYVEFHFPLAKEIWVKRYGSRTSQLDYKRFTYEVVDGKVVLSEPENVKLCVSVAELNDKMSEMTESLVAANATIKEKESEIAQLAVYKDKFEKVEQDRISAEIAEKKSALRSYAVESGLIASEEVEDGGELASLIDANDETGIKTVIAERFMAKSKNPKTPERECSSDKSAKKVNVKVDLTNAVYTSDEVNSIMKSFLGK